MILALIVAGLWWFFGRDGDALAEGSEEAAEPGRECTVVPVVAADEEIAQTALGGLSSAPDEEYCHDIEFIDDVSQAALYVGPDSPATEKVLQDADRSQAASSVPVASVPVGVSGPEQTDADSLNAEDVAFDVEAQPEAAVLVADALGASDLDSSEGAFAATAENRASEGEEFSALDDREIVHHAYVLEENESVSAQQVDAASGVASEAGDNYSGAAETTPAAAAVWEAAGFAAPENARKEDVESDAAAEADAPVAEPAPYTLFLLDTSDALAPAFAPVADAVGQAALRLTGGENQVALWNYSSPLNPGVTQGFRRNLNYTTDGQVVSDVVERFGTGGVPQTREAVAAAVEESAALPETSRVVLVTTGTADESELPPLPEGVELAVIHIGDGEVDQALQDAAGYHEQVTDLTKLNEAVQRASRLAQRRSSACVSGAVCPARCWSVQRLEGRTL
ncbi:hypothetical protein C3B44_05830 [Corynebacterium yudongzhengii]|uniref:VWFA domain-containing protein n=1 Tax=Corynebacterium yudongzhengii TaxID=2080740 RepID=A0A2U1T8Q6_9CORY|nr:hypothetical protein C3B44_05830 [Corynebacterium yudongzhengii]PWC02325.1 hypothetical protein DF222_03050 [Corynebacterium yudongzhengii]